MHSYPGSRTMHSSHTARPLGGQVAAAGPSAGTATQAQFANRVRFGGNCPQ